MTFDKQSNARRTASESKSYRSCNHRFTLQQQPAGAHLKNGEVLENAVHHGGLGQLAQFADEADEIITHRRPQHPIRVADTFRTTVLLLQMTTISASYHS